MRGRCGPGGLFYGRYALVATAKENVQKPNEFGVYVKTSKKLVRIMPNIVFDEESMLHIEVNNPPHFPLKDIRYFIITGNTTCRS